jgi:lipopolysaccharide biosynthesis glycosyltransferase
LHGVTSDDGATVTTDVAVARMKPNVIALAADAAFFPPAAFLATRLAELNPRDDTDIAIFSDAFGRLVEAQRFGVRADLRHVQAPPLPRMIRISGATFYRILIPDNLPPEVRRVLYLDVDTYPEDDRLFRLFDLDMQDLTIAAVRDAFISFDRSKPAAKEFELAGVEKYLNAGVLLIDRERYVGDDLATKILVLSGQRKLHDQAAINAALDGAWLELSPSMNVTPFVRNSGAKEVERPAIQHFMGLAKPWNLSSFAEYHRESAAGLSEYIRGSPWPDFIERQTQVPESSHPRHLRMSAKLDQAAFQAYLTETKFADLGG